MNHSPVPFLDPTCPPGCPDVEPSRCFAKQAPQHPHGPCDTGVGEVGRRVEGREEVFGLATLHGGGREIRARAEVLGPAQDTLPVRREREPSQVSSIDPGDYGKGPRLEPQALSTLGVEDLRDYPELGPHYLPPLAGTGS